jgi:hypothetical protein
VYVRGELAEEGRELARADELLHRPLCEGRALHAHLCDDAPRGKDVLGLPVFQVRLFAARPVEAQTTTTQ